MFRQVQSGSYCSNTPFFFFVKRHLLGVLLFCAGLIPIKVHAQTITDFAMESPACYGSSASAGFSFSGFVPEISSLDSIKLEVVDSAANFSGATVCNLFDSPFGLRFDISAISLGRKKARIKVYNDMVVYSDSSYFTVRTKFFPISFSNGAYLGSNNINNSAHSTNPMSSFTWGEACVSWTWENMSVLISGPDGNFNPGTIANIDFDYIQGEPSYLGKPICPQGLPSGTNYKFKVLVNDTNFTDTVCHFSIYKGEITPSITHVCQGDSVLLTSDRPDVEGLLYRWYRLTESSLDSFAGGDDEFFYVKQGGLYFARIYYDGGMLFTFTDTVEVDTGLCPKFSVTPLGPGATLTSENTYVLCYDAPNVVLLTGDVAFAPVDDFYYEYSWDGGEWQDTIAPDTSRLTIPNWQTGVLRIRPFLPPGFTEDTGWVNIEILPALSADFQFDTAACAALLVDLDTNEFIVDAVDYITYTWSAPGANTESPAWNWTDWTDGYLTYSSNGSHTVKLTVTNTYYGCASVDSLTFSTDSLVSLVDTLLTFNDYSIVGIVHAGNGTPPYTYTWSTYDTCLSVNCDTVLVSDFSNLITVTTVDSKGCSAVFSKTIHEISSIDNPSMIDDFYSESIPGYFEKLNDLEGLFQKYISESKADSGNTVLGRGVNTSDKIVIPTVVALACSTGTGEPVPDYLNKINLMLNGMNDFYDKYPVSTPQGLKRFYFCLATLDDNQEPTTGILKVRNDDLSTLEFFDDGNLDFDDLYQSWKIFDGTNEGSLKFNYKNYLRIFIGRFKKNGSPNPPGNFYAGSFYPSRHALYENSVVSPPNFYDGILIQYEVPNNITSSYDKPSLVVAHEVGHWLDVLHPFESNSLNGGCNASYAEGHNLFYSKKLDLSNNPINGTRVLPTWDFVKDTPVKSIEYASNDHTCYVVTTPPMTPPTGMNFCGISDPNNETLFLTQKNVMDYGWRDCIDVSGTHGLSIGQRERMYYALQFYRPDMSTRENLVHTGVSCGLPVSAFSLNKTAVCGSTANSITATIVPPPSGWTANWDFSVLSGYTVSGNTITFDTEINDNKVVRVTLLVTETAGPGVVSSYADVFVYKNCLGPADYKSKAFFGQHAGVSCIEGEALPSANLAAFNSTPPEDRINTGGTTVTYNDAAGDLKFYAAGNSIWNSASVKLEQELYADANSSQYGIALPDPAGTTYAYLITVPKTGTENFLNRGIRYSKIHLANIQGSTPLDESQFNQPILESVTSDGLPTVIGGTSIKAGEKITAIKICGTSNYWIIIQGPEGDTEWEDKLLFFKLTTGGIIYDHFEEAGASAPSGFLSVSSDGRYMVNTFTDISTSTGYGQSPIDSKLYNLNPVDGTISTTQQLIIGSNPASAFGACFDAKSKFVYAFINREPNIGLSVQTGFSGIYSFPVDQAGTDIQGVLVGLKPYGTSASNGLMLGNDEKIYIAKGVDPVIQSYLTSMNERVDDTYDAQLFARNGRDLGVIHFPSSEGNKGMDWEGVALQTASLEDVKCLGGLSNFIDAIDVHPSLYIPTEFRNPVICSRTPVTFDYDFSASIPNTSVTYTVEYPAGIVGAAPCTSGCGSTFNAVLTNTTHEELEVVYTFTPHGEFSGCDGTPVSITIQVNPPTHHVSIGSLCTTSDEGSFSISFDEGYSPGISGGVFSFFYLPLETPIPFEGKIVPLASITEDALYTVDFTSADVEACPYSNSLHVFGNTTEIAHSGTIENKTVFIKDIDEGVGDDNTVEVSSIDLEFLESHIFIQGGSSYDLVHPEKGGDVTGLTLLLKKHAKLTLNNCLLEAGCSRMWKGISMENTVAGSAGYPELIVYQSTIKDADEAIFCPHLDWPDPWATDYQPVIQVTSSNIQNCHIGLRLASINPTSQISANTFSSDYMEMKAPYDYDITRFEEVPGIDIEEVPELARFFTAYGIQRTGPDVMDDIATYEDNTFERVQVGISHMSDNDPTHLDGNTFIDCYVAGAYLSGQSHVVSGNTFGLSFFGRTVSENLSTLQGDAIADDLLISHDAHGVYLSSSNSSLVPQGTGSETHNSIELHDNQFDGKGMTFTGFSSYGQTATVLAEGNTFDDMTIGMELNTSADNGYTSEYTVTQNRFSYIHNAIILNRDDGSTDAQVKLNLTCNLFEESTILSEEEEDRVGLLIGANVALDNDQIGSNVSPNANYFPRDGAGVDATGIDNYTSIDNQSSTSIKYWKYHNEILGNVTNITPKQLTDPTYTYTEASLTATCISNSYCDFGSLSSCKTGLIANTPNTCITDPSLTDLIWVEACEGALVDDIEWPLNRPSKPVTPLETIGKNGNLAKPNLGQSVPNPGIDRVLLSYYIPSGYEASQIKVIQMSSGMTLDLLPIEPNGAHQLEIDISKYPNGVYAYQMIMNKGAAPKTRNFVVMH